MIEGRTRTTYRFTLDEAETYEMPEAWVQQYEPKTGISRIPQRIEELLTFWIESQGVSTSSKRFLKSIQHRPDRDTDFVGFGEIDILVEDSSFATVFEVKTAVNPKAELEHAHEQLAKASKYLRATGIHVRGCALVVDATREGCVKTTPLTQLNITSTIEALREMTSDDKSIGKIFVSATELWKWAISNGYETSIVDLNRYMASRETESVLRRCAEFKAKNQKAWANQKTTEEAVVHDISGQRQKAIDRLEAEQSRCGVLYRQAKTSQLSVEELEDSLRNQEYEFAKHERDLAIGFGVLGRTDLLLSLETSRQVLGRYFNQKGDRCSLYSGILEESNSLETREAFLTINEVYAAGGSLEDAIEAAKRTTVTEPKKKVVNR